MIVIATDSSACMTKQSARELGVIYIPMTYTLCGKTYTESFIGANGDFVPLLEAEPDPHTSQPAIGRYLQTFKALRKSGFEVLCLTISSRLSGTFSNATACAGAGRQRHPRCRYAHDGGRPGLPCAGSAPADRRRSHAQRGGR